VRFLPSLKKKAAWSPNPGGRRVYAVGDIHGRADLLRRLLSAIEEDARDLAPADRPVLIFIGDYIDRGEDSRGVIDQVLALRRSDRFEAHALKGNHEEALLQFLVDPWFGSTWAEYGGLQTLASYGVSPPLRKRADQWETARDALAAALPPEHLAFFSSLALTVSFGDYTFVHAGVRPGVPLQDQQEHDLLWIRDDFLHARTPLERSVVVHGHTPEAEPYLSTRRIGIDTGAYATGVLTAVRLSGEDCAFLQARSGRE
jgi:serine/threonine protein phosphatase 1